jgi:hypothetical protein
VRDLHNQSISIARPRCQHCGGVIGVYEPLVLIREGGPHTTSIAAEPHLFPAVLPCYHGECYEHRPMCDIVAA